MSTIEYIHSNWHVIKKAPSAFIVFGMLMCFAGFQLNEFINNKTETQLRDQLERTKEVEGILSTLPPEDLKQKTLNLVADIRALLAAEDQERLAIRQRYEDKTKHLGPLYSELDEPALQEAWSEMTTAYVENSQTTLRLYNERYRADAVLLREEIIERLPEDVLKRSDVFMGTKAYTRYYLANSSGIIADIVLDLEKLAKLLPEQKEASTVRQRLAALLSLFFLSPLFPLPLTMRGAALWMAWGHAGIGGLLHIPPNEISRNIHPLTL